MIGFLVENWLVKNGGCVSKNAEWNIPRDIDDTPLATCTLPSGPVFKIAPEAFALERRRCNQGSNLHVGEELVVYRGSFVTQGWAAVAGFVPFDLASVHYSPPHRRSDLVTVRFLSLYGPVVEKGPEPRHFSYYRPSPNDVKHGSVPRCFVSRL